MTPKQPIQTCELAIRYRLESVEWNARTKKIIRKLRKSKKEIEMKPRDKRKNILQGRWPMVMASGRSVVRSST